MNAERSIHEKTNQTKSSSFYEMKDELWHVLSVNQSLRSHSYRKIFY